MGEIMQDEVYSGKSKWYSIVIDDLNQHFLYSQVSSGDIEIEIYQSKKEPLLKSSPGGIPVLIPDKYNKDT